MQAWDEFIGSSAREAESAPTEMLYDLVTKMTKPDPAQRPSLVECIALIEVEEITTSVDMESDSRDPSQNFDSTEQQLAEEFAKVQI